MSFRHVVLLRVYDSVTRDAVDSAVALLRTLSGMPAGSRLRVERSLDGRKGRIIVVDSTFADEAAFSAYRADPRYIAACEAMAQVAESWVGDWIEE